MAAKKARRRKSRTKQTLMVGLSMLAFAAVAPEKAEAQIINCGNGMFFGMFMACGTPNTIVVRPDNTYQVNGCLSLGPEVPRRARCVIRQNFPYRPVQVSVAAATYTITNGAQNMDVNNFNLPTNAGGPSYTAPAAPVVNIPIGATLNVGGGQAAGTYSGTFVVNINLL